MQKGSLLVWPKRARMRVHVNAGKFLVHVRASVPANYPKMPVVIEITKSNFPGELFFSVWMSVSNQWCLTRVRMQHTTVWIHVYKIRCIFILDMPPYLCLSPFSLCVCARACLCLRVLVEELYEATLNRARDLARRLSIGYSDEVSLKHLNAGMAQGYRLLHNTRTLCQSIYENIST